MGRALAIEASQEFETAFVPTSKNTPMPLSSWVAETIASAFQPCPVPTLCHCGRGRGALNDIWRDRRVPIGPVLIEPEGKFDVADPKLGVHMERLKRAGSHHGAIDCSAVGRA